MITVERLRTIPMFAELDEEQLAHLAPLFHHSHYKLGEIVTKQGDPGEAFYVLDAGTLQVRYIDSRDHERVLGYLNAPAFFGETSLFTGLTHDVTIDVFSREADLLVLPKHEFDALVTEYPEIGEDIVVRADVEKKLAQRLYPWLSPGEIALVNTRRHWYALATRLVIPTAIALVLFVLAFGTNALDPAFFSTLSTALLILAIAWTLGVGGWILVDWSNDYYIVTNKRVIHIEKVIFFFEEREEALMEQITNVIEVGEGWAQRAFDFTDLRVETQGRQIDVNFSYVPRSKRVRQVIFEQINRLR
ncbi:MAG: cyclic nucleotide-binding domain-containing protein, partial [Acidobacteriota bacterium]